MMWMDAVDLRDFYTSRLGTVTRRMIGRRIRTIWPDVRGMKVLGIGFPTPYLSPFRGEAERVLAAMPAGQGVLHWPLEGAGLTSLIDECDLPFPDMSMDRVIMVHTLECAENVRPMMREAWRVLAGGGRLMVIVPNRRGLWSRFERTPFGHGRPYSSDQLSRVLRDNLFTPSRIGRALYVPPSQSRMMLSSAPAIEEIGHRWFKSFAGVVIADATKQIYAGQVDAPPERAYIRLPQRSPGNTTRTQRSAPQ